MLHWTLYFIGLSMLIVSYSYAVDPFKVHFKEHDIWNLKLLFQFFHITGVLLVAWAVRTWKA